MGQSIEQNAGGIVTVTAEPGPTEQAAADNQSYRLTIDPDSIGRTAAAEQFSGTVPFGAGSLMVRAYRTEEASSSPVLAGTQFERTWDSEVSHDTPPPAGKTQNDTRKTTTTDRKWEKDPPESIHR
jgi:hypothetical protein